jgi:hypothetical protein
MEFLGTLDSILAHIKEVHKEASLDSTDPKVIVPLIPRSVLLFFVVVVLSLLGFIAELSAMAAAFQVTRSCSKSLTTRSHLQRLWFYWSGWAVAVAFL